MRLARLGVAVGALLVTAANSAHAGGAEGLEGTWRFTQSGVAPWAAPDEAAEAPPPRWLGATLRIDGGHVAGPPPLRCADARYTATTVPHEGLFQGNLGNVSADTIAALALPAGDVPGVSLACSAGVFEFHRVDAVSWLLAIDNRIWTLQDTPGTRALPGTPEATVEALLEAHFAGALAFTAEGVAAARDVLADALRADMAAWFARTAGADEAPELDGDPFTDSQEPPARFAVAAARATPDGDRAEEEVVEVDVRLAFASEARTLTYLLAATPLGWRVTDIRYGDRGTLGALLHADAAPPPAE